MRTLSLIATGMIVGIALTIAAIELSGGWYTYFTVPSDECRDIRTTAEIVPHQPNPCHFRRPRWQLFR